MLLARKAGDDAQNRIPQGETDEESEESEEGEESAEMDLGAIFDAHIRHEFVEHDVAATMKTMVAEPYAA